MQAVVKTPRIEVKIKGDIPPKLLSVLKEEFGEDFHLSGDREEEVVDIFETDWYRKVKAKTTSGDNLRIYRENRGLTQAELGALLGGVPRQHVSNMERGMRPISIKTARKLAEVFEVSPAKFI
jgi:DNA-binding XRE family transcriptional regulator